MKIRSMTASFGGLNGRLELHDGLNVITAPNESGKSTWCAFLLAMLYGIDTAQRKTKGNVLPEKTRYLPWSGAPAQGAMEVVWEGRLITLERTSSPRVPMGILKVYDTQTGQSVPELTADNCGRLLLGVERSVFERTAFLRQSGLTVTPDAALEQRLNALITTGDDSVTYSVLQKKLRELQNSLTGRTGRLRRVEQEMEKINATLNTAGRLRDELERLSQQKQELQETLVRDEALLRRHRQAERYAAWLRVQEADEAVEQARLALSRAEERCQGLPSAASAAKLRAELKELARMDAALRGEPDQSALPTELLRQTSMLPVIVCVLAALAGVGLLAVSVPMGTALLVLGAALTVGFWLRRSALQKQALLAQRQKRQRSEQWLRTYRTRLDAVLTRLRPFAECETLSDAQEALGRAELLRRELEYASDALAAAEKRRQALGDVEPAPYAAAPRISKEAALSSLEEHRDALNALNGRLSLLQGKLETVGEPDALLARREELAEKAKTIRRQAHVVALADEHLRRANEQLQARFAPQISQRAGAIFNRLTEGRYDRLLLQQDLSVEAVQTGSPILRPSAALSCGTVDQIYLSVRLAMVSLLLPEGAPLVLDDALVNFDDHRAKLALDLLAELAEERQILLFTCHGREKRMMEG